MSFTAKDVKALRDATGAGMMDAKKALEAADGDMEAAKQALREKGLAKADARSDRDNDEGTVAIAVDGNTAAVVQIKTETDFSAKNNAVTSLAQTLADAVLTGGPGAVDAHADRREEHEGGPAGRGGGHDRGAVARAAVAHALRRDQPGERDR